MTKDPVNKQIDSKMQFDPVTAEEIELKLSLLIAIPNTLLVRIYII